MCECDYDLPEHFRQANVRARKMHRCTECRGWIAPGETYLKTFGVWDGRAAGYATCSDCQAFAAWAEERNGDDICYSFGNMIHDIGDCLGEMGDRKVRAEMLLLWREVRAKRRAIGIGA